MKKRIMPIAAAVLVLIAISATVHVFAADELTVIKTGAAYADESKTDGFRWTLYSDGNLVFTPASSTKGAKCILSGVTVASNVPWCNFKSEITKVTFTQETFFEKQICYMFDGCENLAEVCGSQYVNLTGVEDLSGLFRKCTNLKTIDVSNWDLSSVTSVESMFLNCKNLEKLDVSKWNTSSIKNMWALFAGCSMLCDLDVSKWDMSSVEDMTNLFYGCGSIKKLDVSEWDTSSASKMNGIFNQCENLCEIDVSDWDTSSAQNMGYMFYGCKNLEKLNVSYWDTSHVSNMRGIFLNCSKISTLDVSRWDLSSADTISGLFQGCSSLQNPDVSAWDTSSVTSMSQVFLDCSSLTYLDISAWDVSSVKYMDHMFSGCPNITSLDVSQWDVSNVKSIYYMFYKDTGIGSLDVSNWDVGNVTDMEGAFEDMRSLENLDVSMWDTSSATTMNSLFRFCSSLHTIDISNWDVSNVKNMKRMFYKCAVYELDFTSWNTLSATVMDNFLEETYCLYEIRAGKNFVFSDDCTEIAPYSDNIASWTLVSEQYSVLKSFSDSYIASSKDMISYQNSAANRNSVNIYRIFVPVEYNLDEASLNFAGDGSFTLTSECKSSVPVGVTVAIGSPSYSGKEFSFSRWVADKNEDLIDSLTYDDDISYLTVSVDAVYRIRNNAIKLKPVIYYTHKYALEKYKYALSTDMLLIIGADKSRGTYYYGGNKMFYTEDENYRSSIEGNPEYVFVTIIPSGSYYPEKLKRVEETNKNETIERNGDVNNDIKVSITDVTDVNNMVKLSGDAYIDMSVRDRLEADINTSKEGAQNRASILDVSSVISLLKR